MNQIITPKCRRHSRQILLEELSQQLGTGRLGIFVEAAQPQDDLPHDKIRIPAVIDDLVDLLPQLIREICALFLIARHIRPQTRDFLPVRKNPLRQEDVAGRYSETLECTRSVCIVERENRW
ncbi:hypothetical protein MB84_04745 [Pandoraea oxalativorans]|uniref:Uncharacterized protein n=1 Tax=Pandoraea oxalativorans TaxID=573737 RepID=A0A0E3U575_9BURK|nr:hypothetical protein MB84_04745 [Pandoraea oxalativorans]